MQCRVGALSNVVQRVSWQCRGGYARWMSALPAPGPASQSQQASGAVSPAATLDAAARAAEHPTSTAPLTSSLRSGEEALSGTLIAKLDPILAPIQTAVVQFHDWTGLPWWATLMVRSIARTLRQCLSAY